MEFSKLCATVAGVSAPFVLITGLLVGLKQYFSIDMTPGYILVWNVLLFFGLTIGSHEKRLRTVEQKTVLDYG